MKTHNPSHSIPEMPSLPAIHKKSKSSPKKTVRQIISNQRPVFPQVAAKPVPLRAAVPQVRPIVVQEKPAFPQERPVVPQERPIVPHVRPIAPKPTTDPTVQRFVNNYPKFVPQYETNKEALKDNLMKSRFFREDKDTTKDNVMAVRQFFAENKDQQISTEDDCMEMPLNLKKCVPPPTPPVPQVVNKTLEVEEEDDEIQILSHFRRESQESVKNCSERVLSRDSSLSSDSIRLRISETPPQEVEDNSQQKTSEESVVQRIQTTIEKVEEQIEDKVEIIEDKNKSESKEDI